MITQEVATKFIEKLSTMKNMDYQDALLKTLGFFNYIRLSFNKEYLVKAIEAEDLLVEANDILREECLLDLVKKGTAIVVTDEKVLEKLISDQYGIEPEELRSVCQCVNEDEILLDIDEFSKDPPKKSADDSSWKYRVYDE